MFQVQEAIYNNLQGRTVIIVAHRLSTVERADRIVVIDKGQVITNIEVLILPFSFNHSKCKVYISAQNINKFFIVLFFLGCRTRNQCRSYQEWWNVRQSSQASAT